MKYVKRLKDGSYKYRRRVPDHLQKVFGKSEFSRFLGRTEEEALRAYPDVHEHFERIIKNIPNTATASEIASLKEQISAKFLELGLSRTKKNAGWDEQTARKAEAERILARYALDEETGHPDRDDVSLSDHLLVTALLDSPESIQAQFTISDVFSHYLEHWKTSQTDQMKVDKYAERISRMQGILLDITGADIPVTELTRQHGRMLRDKLKAQPARSGRGRPAYGTVQRNFNIPKAAINHGIKALDILMTNPFTSIDLGRAPVRAHDLRHPLPNPVIAAMYGELSNNQTLLDIWTLIHHTGAQNTEVLGLKKNDLYLADPIPHFEITPDDERSVKERARLVSLLSIR
jgi:hypothetical protein